MRIGFNNKGISEMVSYVLLIIIAVSVSIIVFYYLKPMIWNPDAAPKCPEDVSIQISELICKKFSASGVTGLRVNYSLVNKGFWNISSTRIKIEQAGKRIKQDLCNYPLSLAPNMRAEGTCAINSSKIDITKTNYEIELIPSIVINKKGAVQCSNAIITQQIVCT